MQGLLVEFQIAEGKSEEFERVMQHIAEISSSEDAGYEYYAVARVNGEPLRYVVTERFSDQAALDAHMANPNIGQAMAAINECLAGPPVVRHLDFLA